MDDYPPKYTGDVYNRVIGELGKVGLRAYRPTGASRFQLLACAPRGWPVTPLYVSNRVASRADFHLRVPTARRLERVDGVAVFCVGHQTWYLPIAVYLSHAQPRQRSEGNPRYDQLFVPRPSDADVAGWLGSFAGVDGARLALRKLRPAAD